MKKICICGPYPDPVGGVSIHIRRLEASASKRFRVEVIDEAPTKKQDIFNFRTFNLIKYFRIISTSDIVHVNSSVVLFRIFHVLFSFFLKKKIVITVHSYRNIGFFSNFLNYICFSLADVNVVVSHEISKIFKHKHFVIPAFICPSQGELILADMFTVLLNDIKSVGKKVVVSNAYRLDFDNGKEIYGFDKLIELFIDQEVRSQYSLILNVGSLTGCEDVFNMHKKFIIENGLSDSVYLFNEKLNFPALLAQSDVSVRATTTDGDALSVRESLMLCNRTIASDCVARPIGTIVYSTNSIASLKSALMMGSFQGEIENTSFDKEILTIYEGLL